MEAPDFLTSAQSSRPYWQSVCKPIDKVAGFLTAQVGKKVERMFPMSPVAAPSPPVPEERWPDSPALQDYLKNHWQEPWGDRRQEMVVIGADIDWPALTAQLDAALLPEGASGTQADLADPFPIWRRQQSA